MNSAIRERLLASLLLILLLTPMLLNQHFLIALSTSKPVGNIVNEINLGKGNLTSILYDPKNGYIYIGFASGNSSGIYVIANYTIVSEIPTSHQPGIMCYNPQNGEVYVDLGRVISVINGTTIVGNISIFIFSSTMLYDRLNGILYVYEYPFGIAQGGLHIIYPGQILAINVSNNKIIGQVFIGKLVVFTTNSSGIVPENASKNIDKLFSSIVTHMLLDPSNGYIYVSLRNGSILVLTPNLKITGIINVNTSVISMLYDPVNGYIYVDGLRSNGVGEVAVINPSNNSVIGFIQVLDYDFYSHSEPVLTYNPSNGYVYVVDGNNVSVISSNKLVAEIPIGSPTSAVIYFPENNYVYVSANGTISVIDPEYNHVIGNFTAPNDLQYSLMTYGNGYIYVADQLTNGTTEVIIIGLQNYSVKFTEVGLPPGTVWNVTLNGVTKASNTSSITFTLPNGEYNYTVASPIFVKGVEYVATKPSGTVIVNGTNVTIIVKYVPKHPPPPPPPKHPPHPPKHPPPPPPPKHPPHPPKHPHPKHH